MTKKATKRKVWYVRGTGLDIAVAGASKTSQAHLDSIRMVELSAIQSFERGMAIPQEYSQLCAMLSLSEALCDMRVRPDARPALVRATAALAQAKEAYDMTGQLAVDGPGLQALRDAYGWHDAQREAVSRSVYETALRKTYGRLSSGHHSFGAIV